MVTSGFSILPSQAGMAKDRPTLADYVEAAERRAAPKVQARGAQRGSGAAPWVILAILTIFLAGGLVYWLRAKGLLPD
jgi:hypothetical protein